MKKVWGVLFTCTRTRAVWLDVATDYSTEAVLHTLRRLMVAKGDIKLIISDPGSQLKGCSRELSSWRAGWSEEQLVRFGSTRGLSWKFVMAASQHQNGPAESMVKLVKGVKKSFMHAMGDTKLSLNEFGPIISFTKLSAAGEVLRPHLLGAFHVRVRLSGGPKAWETEIKIYFGSEDDRPVLGQLAEVLLPNFDHQG